LSLALDTQNRPIFYEDASVYFKMMIADVKVLKSYKASNRLCYRIATFQYFEMRNLHFRIN